MESVSVQEYIMLVFEPYTVKSVGHWDPQVGHYNILEVGYADQSGLNCYKNGLSRQYNPFFGQ